MRYGTKLLVLITAAMLLSCGTAIFLLDAGSKKILWNETRAKALSIAATSAALIDGDMHREIRSREDEAGAAYRSLREQLRCVRDANRREDTWLKYVYTFMPSLENPDVMVFGVDPEESMENRSHVGDVVRSPEARSLRLGEYGVFNNIVTDEWGRWLSAYAPVRDSKGKAVAIMGIDIPADNVVIGESFVQWDGLVCERTYDGVRGTFPLTRLGPIAVKGREEPVVAYSL